MRSRSLFAFDVYILASTLSLIVIGILFIYSSGITSTGELFSTEYLRQIVWASSGLVLLVGLSFLDYSRLKGTTPYVYGIILAILVLTLFFGKVVNGARSWIGIGNLGIQPSEFAKLATILLLARFLDQHRKSIDRLPTFLVGFSITLAPVLLVVLQPDLGTALVFPPIYLLMAFAAGAKLRHVLYVVVLGVITFVLAGLPAWETHIRQQSVPIVRLVTDPRITGLVLLSIVSVSLLALVGLFLMKRRYFYWIVYLSSLAGGSLVAAVATARVLRQYQIMRLIVFLDPYVDPRGSGWNIIQSVTAVGSGGPFGKGFLKGTQSHYQYLPQQSTDFIFSILAEEWGFLGSLLVFGLFLVLMLRGLHIASTAKDGFASLVATGIVGLIFFHFLVNVGMAMGIMPITGIPLLFLSHGGSALWTGMMSVGILMSIYLHRFRYS
ncbi:MAG: rod shape-determining protein RodA [Spirochaetaceae bacterium]